MDLMYLVTGAALWALTWALARGCARLERRRGRA